MQAWLKYFLCAVLAWVVVDFTTTAAIAHPARYYSTYMPALVFFYLGYPLLSCVLIYACGLAGWRLFLAMLGGIAVVEIGFAHNTLLVTLPICLLAIPISLGHYGMVTFMPKWLAEHSLRKNRRWAAATVGTWGLGVLINIVTQFAGRH
jgi:hypothetical protein